MRLPIAALLLLGVLLPLSAHSAPPALTPLERDRLRFKLELLFNERDLMIRNQKADLTSLNHQESELKALKVFERIPFEPELDGLRIELAQSAHQQKIALRSFRTGPLKKAERPWVDVVPFRLVVQGTESDVRAWIRKWPDEQLRLTEPDDPKRPYRVIGGAPGSSLWRVDAHAFRFRAAAPSQQLGGRDPLKLLPPWAQRDPERFARAEPVLWSYVLRSRELAPLAEPHQLTHERLRLNAERMSFFVSKALPRS